MSGRAKTSHRAKPKAAKPGPRRGWHVSNYLPTPGGLTEAEARRLHGALVEPGELIAPEGSGGE